MSISAETQYLDLLRKIKLTGERTSNRTGIDTYMIPGATIVVDLRRGFPAVTTKKLAFNAVKGELIAFMEGTDKLSRFQELGCKVWDENCASPAWQNNPACYGPDDLGRIYGKQWREYRGIGLHGEQIQVDQLSKALETIRHDPDSRRIIVNAWNPAELSSAALPPCHVLFQFLPNKKTKVLHMTMYQRSCDMFLGIPFNMASYALLLELFAKWTGYKAGTLTMFLADVHIYDNHLEQVCTQLSRVQYHEPQIIIRNAHETDVTKKSLTELVKDLKPEHIELFGYNYHPAILAPMAV